MVDLKSLNSRAQVFCEVPIYHQNNLLPRKYLSNLLLKLLSQRNLKIFSRFLVFTGSAISEHLFHFIVLFCRLKPLFTHPLQIEHASTICSEKSKPAQVLQDSLTQREKLIGNYNKPQPEEFRDNL